MISRFAIALSAAAVSALLASPAAADSDLSPGSFVRQTQHWDPDSNSFRPGAAKGEGNACWQVLATERAEITLKHISGDYHPWWSERPIPPGTTDKWFDSDHFREKNPGKPPLTEIKTIFETVPSCQQTV